MANHEINTYCLSFYHCRKPTPYACGQKLLGQYNANTVDELKQYPEEEEVEDIIQQQKQETMEKKIKSGQIRC